MRRSPRATDLGSVLAICNHPRVLPYLTYERMDEQAFAPIFEELLQSGCFWIWEQDGRVAGFYKATRLPGRAGHVLQLGMLAVDPQQHGRGTGRTMIEDALQRCRGQGIRRVQLFAESDNLRALAFYERLGFVREGTLRGYYRRASDPHDVDEIVLGLTLA